MIRDRFEGLHVLSIVQTELVDDLVQHVLERHVERLEVRNARLDPRDAVATHLDQRAIADQRVFGEVLPERCRFASVTSVERRERSERGGIHVPVRPIQRFGVRIIHASSVIADFQFFVRGVA